MCCIKKIYESVSLNNGSGNNLKDFLEYGCCLDCLNEGHEKKQKLSAEAARNHFATDKQNSSSLDEPMTEKVDEIQVNFEKQSIIEEKILKNDSRNELSLKEEITENTNSNENLQAFNSDSKHSFIELFFESKIQNKSPSVCSILSQNEKKTENQLALNANVQNVLDAKSQEPIVNNQSLPTTNISVPFSSQSLPSKSLLKQKDKNKPLEKSAQKSHVSFFDEKFGFQSTLI